MPTYDQRCTKCKHEFEDFRFIAHHAEDPVCPKCGAKTKRFIGSREQMAPGFDVEMESEALGVNPSQIREIQKQFPHHRFNPHTGAMLIGSHQEKKRILKDIGYRDWDSYYQ